MAYKLIALDVDGTLLDPSGVIRPRVWEAVRQASAMGCIVTLATGRRHRSARGIAAQLGLATPLILYSGSLVYDPGSEEALLHRPLPADFVARAVEVLQELGLRPGIFQSPVAGEGIFLGPAEYDDAFLSDYARHPSRCDLVHRVAYTDLVTVDSPLTVFTTGPGSLSDELTARLAALGDLACNVYSYSLRQSALPDLHGFDLLPSDHTKAVAVKWLAAHHGLSLAETLVVGDGGNDIEMLKVAGLGVAMGQASSVVKAAADVIVSSNAEDGVAEAIERFVLKA